MLHFNDNKYRFQLIREVGSRKNKKAAMEFKFPHDNGNIQKVCPIAALLAADKDIMPRYNASFFRYNNRSTVSSAVQ